MPRLPTTPYFSSSHVPRPSHSANYLYERALDLVRRGSYSEARSVFESLLQEDPSFCKAWVSYAQVRTTAALTRSASALEPVLHPSMCVAVY